jgi:hypothetical protein
VAKELDDLDVNFHALRVPYAAFAHHVAEIAQRVRRLIDPAISQTQRDIDDARRKAIEPFVVACGGGCRVGAETGLELRNKRVDRGNAGVPFPLDGRLRSGLAEPRWAAVIVRTEAPAQAASQAIIILMSDDKLSACILLITWLRWISTVRGAMSNSWPTSLLTGPGRRRRAPAARAE